MPSHEVLCEVDWPNSGSHLTLAANRSGRNVVLFIFSALVLTRFFTEVVPVVPRAANFADVPLALFVCTLVLTRPRIDRVLSPIFLCGLFLFTVCVVRGAGQSRPSGGGSRRAVSDRNLRTACVLLRRTPLVASRKRRLVIALARGARNDSICSGRLYRSSKILEVAGIRTRSAERLARTRISLCFSCSWLWL